MLKPEIKVYSDMSNTKSSPIVHPMDIALDDNNNETPVHMFGTGKRYDSGLGILSPQSDDSLTNLFPDIDHKNVDQSYSTIIASTIPTVMISPSIKWNSLFETNEDSPHQVAKSSKNVIELNTLDSNNNMATSIVIYRDDNNQFRHINIIDYPPKYGSTKVRRSNTFSNDQNGIKHSTNHRELWRSTDNLTFAQTSLSTYDLCNDLFRDSSLISNSGPGVYIDDSNNDDSLKSSSKILQILISALCCRKKRVSLNEISEEEIETLHSYRNWKFSLVEFDDITYFSSGAQGTIYTATLKDVKVALKKVKDSLKRDDIHIERLVALQHKNIVTFIGVSEEPPNYLVMEFCSNGQLFHWLRRDVEISPQDVSSWAYQICDGMAYLHKNDIIHRDLKSPNILIADDYVLKIIDFEFSKDCCESKMLNSFVGTMAWMAPEVLREETHTKKVDVWSYGVVLWEMITREIPYYGIERLSILFGVGNNCLSLPMCCSIPQEMKELLRNCWEQNPEKRHSFQDILDNFCDYFNCLESYSLREFIEMQQKSKQEIESEFLEMNKEKISTSKVEAELIRRRTKELNDAKNIKELYNKKLRRADNLIALLNKCLNAVADERKKNDCEWRLIQKLKQIIQPHSSNIENQCEFISPEYQNRIKNITIPLERSQRIVFNNRLMRKDRGSNRYSMLEQDKIVDKSNRVRRKHSFPSFRDRNYFHGIKAKCDTTLNIRNPKPTKVRSQKTSLSLETLVNNPKRSGSRNEDNLNKKTENRWKRNSSPCRHVVCSTLSSPNKSTLNCNDLSGTINPSFQGSCNSFATLRELQMTNLNMQQSMCLDTSISISDVNNSPEIMDDSLNICAGQSLFHRNLLEESISECPQTEESHSLAHGINMNQNSGNVDAVVIRGTSGRCKNLAIRYSSYQSDSLDVSTLNPSSQTAHSLIEKETIAQGLIKPFGFLAHVNGALTPETAAAYSNTGIDDLKWLTGIVEKKMNINSNF